MFKIQEFSKDKKEWSFALGIRTVGEYYKTQTNYNLLNIGFWKYSVWIRIPELIKPKIQWVDTSHFETRPNSPKGYNNTIQKSYGFSFHKDALHIDYGIQPGCWLGDDPKNSNHTKVFFNGWEETRRIRYEFFDLNHNHFAFANDKPNGAIDFDSIQKCEKEVPKVQIKFNDYDGEEITASCYVYEMEWEFGKGLFKWVKFFRSNIIVTRLNLSFDKEVGPKKGSWKGGTLGHSCDVKADEGLFSAFSRYGEEHNFSNLRVVH